MAKIAVVKVNKDDSSEKVLEALNKLFDLEDKDEKEIKDKIDSIKESSTAKISLSSEEDSKNSDIINYNINIEGEDIIIFEMLSELILKSLKEMNLSRDQAFVYLASIAHDYAERERRNNNGTNN